MIRMRYWLAALALASTLAGTAFAGARDDLDAFSKGLKGLDGSFEQKLYDLDGRLKETSKGRTADAAFSRTASDKRAADSLPPL